jgi:ribonuclease R
MWSHARFTYTEVAAILANTRGPEAARARTGARPAEPARRLPRAAQGAPAARRGGFETTETQIVCDDNGRIEKIVPRTRNDAHKLIEEAMLAANVCSADFIAAGQAPGLYRVHEGPTPEKRRSCAATSRPWAWA